MEGTSSSSSSSGEDQPVQATGTNVECTPEEFAKMKELSAIQVDMGDYQAKVDSVLIQTLQTYNPNDTFRLMATHMMKWKESGTAEQWNPLNVMKLMSAFFRISDDFDGKDASQLDKIVLTFKVVQGDQARIERRPLRWLLSEVLRVIPKEIGQTLMMEGSDPWLMFARKGNSYQMEYPIKVGITVGKGGTIEAKQDPDAVPLKGMEE
jgi:hypothetical protein